MAMGVALAGDAPLTERPDAPQCRAQAERDAGTSVFGGERRGSRAGPRPIASPRARALAPLIAAQADRIERQREIVPEVLAALHDARLFRMVLPRSVGGLEVDPMTLMQTIEEIAKADGSTAWCLSQASGCSVAAAYVAPEVAREVFGDARAVMASGPLGSDPKAVAVADGYRVSGSWSFASGIKHASWLACHCALFEPTARRGSRPTANRPSVPCCSPSAAPG